MDHKLYERADAYASKCEELATAIHREGHPVFGEILALKGEILLFLDKPKEALECLNASLAICLKTMGADSHPTLQLSVNRAETQLRLRQFDDAKFTAVLLIKKCQDIGVPEDSTIFLAAMQKLACAYEAKGDYEKADVVLRKLISVQEIHFPEMKMGRKSLLERRLTAATNLRKPDEVENIRLELERLSREQ
jgi:tetratricopeptide (TPR) repeat protein